MKALLTGASGFSGAHLTRYLASEDIEVYSMSVSGQESSRRFRIDSVTDYHGICRAMQECRPDYVFHLAGVTSAKDTADMYRVNLLYAVALLDAMELAGLSKVPLLLVGTAAEAGPVGEKDLPLTESHPPEPVSHYGASKLAQTNAGLAAARMGRPVVVARPFNIIGPGVPRHLVVGNILDQVSRASPANGNVRLALGNVDTTRDFIDIEDVVACYLDLVRTPAAYGKVVNVCTGQETSVRQIINSIAALTGLEITVDVTDSLLRKHEIPRHYGDNQRLQELTARSPTLDLDCVLTRSLAQGAMLQ